jgi:SAM dependent carboxyl methyltransferase
MPLENGAALGDARLEGIDRAAPSHMEDNANSGSPAPMEGRGVYNRSSHVQAVGLSPAVPLFEQAARAVPLADAPEATVIADYGASEGRNSLAPMALAIGALRNRVGLERAISVVHTDLPGSDFSALFEMLDTDPESYLRDDATFASAVGRSFYRQILPSERRFSFTAVASCVRAPGWSC